jgi:predicted metal-binding protein
VSDVEPTDRASVLVCITCRDVTDPPDRPRAGLDGPCLVVGARLLAGAADGIMPWRGRPEPLKRGLIARVPPVSFSGEPP